MALNLEKMHSARAKEERIPEGTYMSRISAIIDLGIQPQTDWQTGEPTDSKPRALLTWTLPTEVIEREHDDGRVEVLPRLISKEYTLSNYDQSNLMKLVKTMKPGLSSLTELLSEPCMVSIGSTVNGNAKVTSCVKAPAGMPIDELETDPVYFDFDNPDEAMFLSLPQWVRTKITEAENYTGFADEWGAQEEAA
jgi:hypothetical protein